ncbi:MAG: hypothetical protein HC828_21645 [Blastochloris sp.]|nr:hypothetical protein [Blastochloris sp.]
MTRLLPPPDDAGLLRRSGSDEMIVDAHAYLSSLPKVSGFTPADAGLPADAHPGQMLLVDKTMCGLPHIHRAGQ